MSKPKKTPTKKESRKPTLQSVQQAALKLSHDDRLELIDLLAVSLNEETGRRAQVDSNGDQRGTRFHPKLLEEIKRRSREYDAGRVRAVPWSEVKRSVAKELRADA